MMKRRDKLSTRLRRNVHREDGLKLMGFLSRLIGDAAGGRHVSRREALYGFIGAEKKRSPTRSLFDERLFQERLFPPRFLSIYLSIQPPSALNPRPITSWPLLQDYDLRGGNALADLFIGGKLAISPITASTGHHVLGIKSRREEGARARG